LETIRLMTKRDSAPFSIVTEDRPLRAGILGCGWFGGVHAERLSALPGVHVAAVCDLNRDTMRRVVGRIAGPGCPPDGVAEYTDYREMIRCGDLDILVVCSPDAMHVEQVLEGLAGGLHVLSEKPLTIVPAEVATVVDEARAARRLVGVTYPFRYHRPARILRAELQSGRWGRTTSITMYQQEDWITPNRGTWRHDPKMCPGGCFADANGHEIDAALWMTGMEAAWVRATSENRGTPLPMTTWGDARVVYPGQEAEAGAPLSFSFDGNAHMWKHGILIITEEADFMISRDELLYSDGRSALAPFPESEVDPDVLAYPDNPDLAFLNALRGGPPILTPPESVLPVLRFTLAGLASAANGGVRCPVPSV
jgi:predicted dehydrogenase